MARRSHMSRRKSRKDFRRKSFVHPKNNYHPMVSRGGIRA